GCASASIFAREFGAAPRLRAALHPGPVITGEVGGSRRGIVRARYTARPRLVLGLPPARRDDAVSGLAAPGRREDPDGGFAGIHGLPAACPPSPVADGVVATT